MPGCSTLTREKEVNLGKKSVSEIALVVCWGGSWPAGDGRLLKFLSAHCQHPLWGSNASTYLPRNELNVDSSLLAEGK